MSSLKEHTLGVTTFINWCGRHDGKEFKNAACGPGKFYGREVEYCSEYGEPGYETKRGIFFANWNKLPRCIQDLLEREGFDCRWQDEWYVDHESGGGKAYRTTGDSYGWTSSIRFTEDGYVLTPDSDPEAILASLINNPDHAMTDNLRVDLAAHGFKLEETDKESGWYPGQDDDPKSAYERLSQENDDAEIVFEITRVGQFDCGWQIWMRVPHPGS